MTNVEMTVKGKKLVIEVDLTQSHGLSKSGKTIIIGTTHGFSQVSNGEGTNAIVSLNVTRYPKPTN